jgi:phosphohistidine phosphatase
VERSVQPAPRRRSAASGRPQAGFQLFLIRHAHAVDAARNLLRPLSLKGRRQAAELARFLKRNGVLKIDELWHSPLARSVETAGILGRDLALNVPGIEMPGLEPFDPPGPVAKRITALGRDLAIVGHEPQLSALAGLLLGRKMSPAPVEMKKGACLALEYTGEGWRIRWMVVPRLFEKKVRRGA